MARCILTKKSQVWALDLAVALIIFVSATTFNGWGAIRRAAGYIVGTLRWLREFFPNIPLFAPRWSLAATEQIGSLPGSGFVFEKSGGGGDFNKCDAIARVPSVKAFRKNFKIAAFLIVLNIAMFMVGLQLTNAVCLFINTFFIVSMLLGNFVSENKPGKSILHGWGDAAFGVLGFLPEAVLKSAVSLK